MGRRKAGPSVGGGRLFYQLPLPPPPKNVIVNKFYAHLALRFMEQVHTAYLAKSFGGSDNLGNRWMPLKPETNIYKPLARGESSTYGIRQYKSLRGLLTPSQDRVWRMVFRAVYLSRKESLGDVEAKALAARIAWTRVREMGAKTKKDVLANRQTQINVRTGRLLNAFLPGRISASGEVYIPGSSDQRVTAIDGMLSIVIAVPYAQAVDVVRPLIPTNSRQWLQEAITYASVMSRDPRKNDDDEE